METNKIGQIKKYLVFLTIGVVIALCANIGRSYDGYLVDEFERIQSAAHQDTIQTMKDLHHMFKETSRGDINSAMNKIKTECFIEIENEL